MPYFGSNLFHIEPTVVIPIVEPASRVAIGYELAIPDDTTAVWRIGVMRVSRILYDKIHYEIAPV